jgi:hypothetical protein
MFKHIIYKNKVSRNAKPPENMCKMRIKQKINTPFNLINTIIIIWKILKLFN